MTEHEITRAKKDAEELQLIFNESIKAIENMGSLRGYDIEYYSRNGENIDIKNILVTVCWGPK